MKEELILREATFNPKVKTYIFFVVFFFIHQCYWYSYYSDMDIWPRAMDERKVLQNVILSNHE